VRRGEGGAVERVAVRELDSLTQQAFLQRNDVRLLEAAQRTYGQKRSFRWRALVLHVRKSVTILDEPAQLLRRSNSSVISMTEDPRRFGHLGGSEREVFPLISFA